MVHLIDESFEGPHRYTLGFVILRLQGWFHKICIRALPWTILAPQRQFHMFWDWLLQHNCNYVLYYCHGSSLEGVHKPRYWNNTLLYLLCLCASVYIILGLWNGQWSCIGCKCFNMKSTYFVAHAVWQSCIKLGAYLCKLLRGVFEITSIRSQCWCRWLSEAVFNAPKCIFGIQKLTLRSRKSAPLPTIRLQQATPFNTCRILGPS